MKLKEDNIDIYNNSAIILSNKTTNFIKSWIIMLIILSSFTNLQAGKIPLTLVLVFLFYIVNEIIDGIFKKDNVSHLGHIIGAVCGCLFGFYLV